MYEMNLDQTNKTFQVKVVGFIKEDEAQRYMTDFQANVNKISPAEYTLVVDGTEQAATPQDNIENLKGALKFYETSGFNKVAIVEPKSAVSRVQVNKCVKDINFKGKVFKTLEEALKY